MIIKFLQIVEVSGIDKVMQHLYSIIVGLVSALIGYFFPVFDILNVIILFFTLDVVFGWLKNRKMNKSKFSTKIIWKTTIPNMLVSITLILLAYVWDVTYKQQYVNTFMLVGWFISGVLLTSIAKNMYLITGFNVLPLISHFFKEKIKEQTNIDIAELHEPNKDEKQ